jgi:hypothetical protein
MSFIPGVGDVIDAAQAVDSWKAGRKPEAILDTMGAALPLVSGPILKGGAGMLGMVGMTGRKADDLTDIAKASKGAVGKELYHVVPESFSSTDNLMSGYDLVKRGDLDYSDFEGKWPEYSDYVNSEDFYRVSFHDRIEDAREYAEKFGGKIKKIVIPEDEMRYLRMGTNSEGYTVLDYSREFPEGLPSEWLEDVK